MGAEDIHFLDKHTQIDNMLVELQLRGVDISEKLEDIRQALAGGDTEAIDSILEILQENNDIQNEVEVFTHPRNGTRATFTTGTWELDYEQGTIKAPDGTITQIGKSLVGIGKDFLRALTINADTEIVVQFDAQDKIIIRAGSWPIWVGQQFKRVKITTTASTEILISAATNPDAIVQMYGEISPVTITFTGGVYENEHTMADDLKYRFSATTLLLRDVIIKVSTHDAVFGDSTNQRYPKTAGNALGFTQVDLSELYIKNAGAGSNTKINILGTKV